MTSRKAMLNVRNLIDTVLLYYKYKKSSSSSSSSSSVGDLVPVCTIIKPGGKNKCEHKRQKSKCKDCGGSQVCEHKRRKAYCKDCGRSQICEHKRKRG